MEPSTILLIAMLAGSAVDIGTTERALQHPGTYELNPLLRNRGLRITVNIAIPLTLHRVMKGRSTKHQIMIAAPYLGSKAFAGWHNWRIKP